MPQGEDREGELHTWPAPYPPRVLVRNAKGEVYLSGAGR